VTGFDRRRKAIGVVESDEWRRRTKGTRDRKTRGKERKSMKW
jgi:hypothetical protein